MSQAAVRLRDPVDLEEFERKLRSAAPDPKQGGDPLQELSRLIGVQKDSLDQLFAAEAKAPAVPAANIPAVNPPAQQPAAPTPRIDVAHIDERLLRPAAPKPPVDELADISALLNQFPDAAARFAAAPPPAAPHVQHHDELPPFAPEYDEATYRSAYHEPAKSRRPLLLMGAALVVLIGGIGTVVLSRSGHGTGGTPTIQASSAPVKVQPAAPAASEQAQQPVSVLDKANTERLAGSRVVTREEQPVDIRAQARVNGTATPGVIALPAGPSSGATAGNGFPEPRSVKTVSVRPDGSVITGDPAAPRPAAAPVAAPTPSMVANPPLPAARPSAAAPAPAAPKTTARATAAAPAAPVERPQAEATPAPKPQAERPAAAAGNGDFAVQLAAPGSEAEARQVMSRLTQKFGSELGGRKLSFKKAAVGDKSVFRVRVSGLSHEGATSLCTKLQAKGGNCFVAKN